VTLFSDGIAGRLLVVNLIFQLEKEGILDSILTDKIFESSIDQANSFLDSSDEIDNMDMKELTKTTIEKAVEMLRVNLSEIQIKRDSL
jgi:hypothetical protein